MIIGIDGNEANIENRVGVGEYAYHILCGIYNLYKNNKEHNHYNIYLKDKAREDLPTEDGNWRYIVCGPRKMWTQWGLPIYLFTHWPRPDVFFTPSHYSPRFCPCYTVMSIMDVSYLCYENMFNKNDLYQLRNWTAYSVKKAAKVLTISQFSKNAIIEKYGIAKDKIRVIYPALKNF